MGFTLAELAIAMAMASLVLAGMLTLHAETDRRVKANRALAELADAGRAALLAVEGDLRATGFLGLAPPGTPVAGASIEGSPSPIAVAGDCGPGWTLLLARPVQAGEGPWALGCGPWGGAAAAGSDWIVTRSAGDVVVSPEPGRLQLASNLETAATAADGGAAAGLASPVETRNLALALYYVARGSSLGGRVPSLRRKVLQSGPRLTDEELMPGVEDLQVLLGLDLDPPGGAGRGAVDLYLPPSDPRAGDPAARVVAVRLCLRLAAPAAVPGVGPPPTTSCGGPAPPADGRVRLVLTRTVALRNPVAS